MCSNYTFLYLSPGRARALLMGPRRTSRQKGWTTPRHAPATPNAAHGHTERHTT